MRVFVHTMTTDAEACGVGNHTARLVQGLARRGLDVVVGTSSRAGWDKPPPRIIAVDFASMAGIGPALSAVTDAAPDVVVLPYVPFMLGRGGMSLAYPVLVRRLAARWPCLMIVHEPSGSFSLHPKHFAMWAWHSVTLGAMLRAVSRTVFSIRYWLERARRFFMLGDKPCRVIPVGSSIARQPVPPRPPNLAPSHANPLQIGTFWTDHPGMRGDWILAAVRTIHRDGVPVVLVALGRSSATLQAATEYPVEITGPLEPAAMSARLASLDLMLLPYSDGVSTRRTGFFAAIEHGLPVVTTTGYATDPRDLPHAVTAAPSHDRGAFIRLARLLAGNGGCRARQASVSEALHRRRFQWELLHQQWHDELIALAHG